MGNKNIYAVICSSMPTVHNAEFFATEKGAKKHLKTLAQARKNQMGVHNFEEKEDGFSFLLGWEEVKVSFYILSVPIKD